MNNPFFSIAIPAYEMNNFGKDLLSNSFRVLCGQTFQDFEVVVSDHSQNNDIEDLCKEYGELLNIKYCKNIHKRGESSPNINNAIKKCSGAWIKTLWQDDFLYHPTSLEKLSNHIRANEGKVWFITACEHSHDGHIMYRPFYPKWNNDMHLGNNTFSGPSVLTIKNTDNKLFFNEDLIWLMDVEYYKRMYDIHGEPSYLLDINVVSRTWSGVGEKYSVTDTLSQERKQREMVLMKKTYG